jgi:hypothetical protein
MSDAVVVADGVAALLNAAPAGTFSPAPAFTASRVWQSEAALENLAALRVDVTPGPMARERASRKVIQRDATAIVTIRQRLPGTNEKAEIDALLNLCEAVEEYLAGKAITGPPVAAWLKSDLGAITAGEDARQRREYCGRVQVTYRMVH